MGAVRKTLDTIYNVCGFIAAMFLLLILITIVAQMVGRWASIPMPGATDFAGYFMAGASFFALTYALNHGAHIRVSLLLSKLGRYRRLGEIWCFSVATVLATFFAVNAVEATWLSHKLNDISQGQDATPLWIPQLSMAIGTVVLAIGLADHLVRVVFGGSYELGSAAVEISTE